MVLVKVGPGPLVVGADRELQDVELGQRQLDQVLGVEPLALAGAGDDSVHRRGA
jgi:hypothetical protein